MGVETSQLTTVTCDNPDCPGTDLDEHNLTGWHLVNREIYGQPPQQFAFCSPDCLTAAANNPGVDIGTKGEDGKPPHGRPS